MLGLLGSYLCSERCRLFFQLRQLFNQSLAMSEVCDCGHDAVDLPRACMRLARKAGKHVVSAICVLSLRGFKLPIQKLNVRRGQPLQT